MFGYMQGFSDSDHIRYCPKCGERVCEFFADGSAKCDACGFLFGVICVDGQNALDEPED
jgi:uncharacterized protein (DUF983 family)